MNKLRPVKTYSELSTLLLNDQTKFRLNEINKLKAVIKKLSKYTVALYCTDKTCYKCYWNFFRSNKCNPYFSVFFNYRNNKETIKRNKKKEEKT